MANIEFKGKVIHGEHYGRVLGFPTANIDRREYVRKGIGPRLGVWAGKVEVGKKQIYSAAIVIGPIDKKGLPKIEAHLINFSGNLYGKTLALNLEKYLRPFKKFKSEKQLKAQIAQDIKRV